MPEPISKTVDGRDIYGFKIAGVSYKVRDPYPEEIKRIEIQIARKYVGAERDSEQPEEWIIDSQFAAMLASIIEPKLHVDELRRMPKAQYYALLTALQQTVKINDMAEVEFFLKPDQPNAVLNNAGVRVDFPASGSINLASTTILGSGSTMVSTSLKGQGTRRPRRRQSGALEAGVHGE